MSVCACCAKSTLSTRIDGPLAAGPCGARGSMPKPAAEREENRKSGLRSLLSTS